MLQLRAASTADAETAKFLIREAGADLLDLLTGSSSRSECEQVLAELWHRPGNRFSAEFATIAEADGHPAGLLVSYPESSLKALNDTTFRQLLALRFWKLARSALAHPVLAWQVLNKAEATADSWYVCILATCPAYRGKGIGRALLDLAGQQARLAGCRSVSLMVADENDSAKRLYRQAGFAERTWQRYGQSGAATMEKPL